MIVTETSAQTLHQYIHNHFKMIICPISSYMHTCNLYPLTMFGFYGQFKFQKFQGESNTVYP